MFKYVTILENSHRLHAKIKKGRVNSKNPENELITDTDQQRTSKLQKRW